mmetsp:Transcript_10650/g.21077  ORF Transcript_10650/g.21077 Transcript_10650/m.21077 type:complete len:205 (+) Transcript_10650:226-840(+)
MAASMSGFPADRDDIALCSILCDKLCPASLTFSLSIPVLDSSVFDLNASILVLNDDTDISISTNSAAACPCAVRAAVTGVISNSSSSSSSITTPFPFEYTSSSTLVVIVHVANGLFLFEVTASSLLPRATCLGVNNNSLRGSGNEPCSSCGILFVRVSIIPFSTPTPFSTNSRILSSTSMSISFCFPSIGMASSDKILFTRSTS